MIIEPKNKKEAPQQKYLKPKILLIDLPSECIDNVKSAGFNASSGTFGSPYKVMIEDKFTPVIGKASLPNYTEQEVIFIDLTPPRTLESPEGEKETSMGEEDFWAKCSVGVIDPRPMKMIMIREYFDRILKYGGLFVIFAQPRLSQNLFLGQIDTGHGLVIKSKIYAGDNWSFLSILNNLRIEADFGKEIVVPNHDHQIFHFLRKNIKEAKYTATFNPQYIDEKSWLPILNNKFESCVGVLIIPRDKDFKGVILILPQISNKPEAIVTLLREVLPDISPHLFPHIEGVRWVERDDYELESVLKYKTDKIKVQDRAKSELEELDKRILEERKKLGFIHGIITKTGYDLVLDVKSCLELIGFKQVIDVDEQIKEQGTTAPKQEDLQVHDKSPTLLLEVKGLSGLPNESDTIQVVKYIPRRMKEWKKTDVRGVSIINHQRNIPAFERENLNAFSNQQVKDAENHDITLLTTRDLFLLIKGMIKWGWKPNVIFELFYKSGRMSKLPTNYTPIGEVANFWEKTSVVGLKITENRLHKGDRIGYVTPNGYFEEDIISIQVNNKDVEEANAGQSAGVKTVYSKEQLRNGTIACIVMKT
jgi:hypothetical protein